jgi:soluble lytic murein transglycosylase-like protein
MDVVFARSRRRALVRRRQPPSRPGRKTARTFLLAIGLFAVLGELGGLGMADRIALGKSRAARPPAAAAACPVPSTLSRAFDSAARQTRLPRSLLVAIAYEESGMDQTARSHAGAQGLLQLMPATARELRVDPTRPSRNVLAGARYLGQMLRRFGTLDLALSAYNAGPAAVERFGGAPTLETLSYVENVKLRAASLAARCG